jgi:hypothetical protein
VALDAGPNGNQVYDEVVAAISINQSLLLIFSTITDSAAQPDNATEEIDDTDGVMGTPLPSLFVVPSAGKSRSKRKRLHQNEDSVSLWIDRPHFHGLYSH